MKRLTYLILLSFFGNVVFAQGDGARMLLWGPKGVTGAIPKWMHLEQNMLPANILVKDANVTINAFPITIIHNFELGGRFAQIMVNGVPGSVKGSLSSTPGIPTPELSSSGFADGFIGFKLGLVNQPALNVKEFAAHKHEVFSMMGYFRIWYPGSYDAAKALNLGSNRVTFELGFPVNLFLGHNPKRPFWLESYPAIHLYTSNSNPTFITPADKTSQLALFSFENHLSKNFTDKFWAGIDLRYQYGGAVKLDGVKQDNTINALGAGFTAGYQLMQPLGINASYGRVLGDGSNLKAEMFKLTVVFSYVNLKKLQ